MSKKWLALVPAIALVVALLPFQTAGASSENELEHSTQSEIPAHYDALLEWPPEEQPIVKQGSQSFEVEFIQVMTSHFGFETEVDGVFGPHTEQQVRHLQAEKGLVQDGIVGVNTWTVLLEEYSAQTFQVERAFLIAEQALDNNDLIFSSNGVLHENSDGNTYYSVKAQSQELIDSGGTGTVGFYDVYNNGDVVESEPK